MQQIKNTLLFMLIFLVGCATTPLDDFSKIHVSMNKDQVLELLGSPNRSEQVSGKEKWAYRFYTGENKEKEELRQITFYRGKVISFGEDSMEIQRLGQIKESDERRSELHRAAKAAIKPAPSTEPLSSKKPVLDEDTSKYYQDMTGK